MITNFRPTGADVNTYGAALGVKCPLCGKPAGRICEILGYSDNSPRRPMPHARRVESALGGRLEKEAEA